MVLIACFVQFVVRIVQFVVLVVQLVVCTLHFVVFTFQFALNTEYSKYLVCNIQCAMYSITR